MGDVDYVEWINSNLSKRRPLFSEFLTYTKSSEKEPLEDYTTFSLAICIESDPAPFKEFLIKTLNGYERKRIKVVWPQCIINANRLDLLIGFSEDDTEEIQSCLVIEAKVEDKLTEGQLKKYLGKGKCDYLAITKSPEDEINVDGWKKKTWQELAESISLSEFSNRLWREYVNSMSHKRIIIDLKGVPKMEINDFTALIDTGEKIMKSVNSHYYEKKVRKKLESLGFYYYDGGESYHWSHLVKDQLIRCKRFTIACNDDKDDKSWLLFGLFQWRDDEGKQEWFAGAVIERKPEEDPAAFKQKIRKKGIEQKKWILYNPEDSIDTTFGKHLVAMKSKPLSTFSKNSDVVKYINSIIDEMGDKPFVENDKNIIYA